MKTDTSSGTYTTSGGKLVITDADASDAGAGETGDEDVAFCAKGNTLSVRLTTSEGMIMHYTATRQ